jgi:carbon monoxide dehydrogenase subunit G
MAPQFTVDLVVPGSPAQVWQRLWDLDRHTAAVPLTTVTGDPLGPGARFSGRTAVGPLGFDDDMVVRTWDPPRRAVVDKVGRVVTGSIVATLEPVADGTLLRWRQTYGAARVPGRVAALTLPAVRAAYRSALRRITAP